ncbi:FAD-dependent oxidoreductase [Dietzia psychralcaliphila]|uniref:Pyridine nucleotide-disulfide oxidoreductase n=1 Tax=Dietzia psychralcaliphila TaxID=139021 RepID=A0AAD0JTM7_9ACTN|nr:FAD-dependent oxidoreductase [Dietzia psychralcaliphila]AWH96392.1 pyridine nucleotide-disulfide oxidoreductase [Dietzia psychralcaliphila]PTM90480.1 NADH dehydrogenase FAD-containing subunit [Dietzia psychralcaliphila]
MSRPRIVVVGLGDTGVLTAIALRRHGDVVGITAKPEFVSGQELGLRLARPEAWTRDYRIAYSRFRGLDHARIVHGSATALDSENRIVRITLADGTAAEEPYDVLVVATGVTNGFWRHPTLQDSGGVDADISLPHQRLAASRTVAIIGGGAAALSSAAQVAERWPTKTVDVYFPGDRALPHHHDLVWDRVRSRLEDLGVGLHPGHRAELPAGAGVGDGDGDSASHDNHNDDDDEHLTSAPVSWTTGQAPTTADVVIWAIGRVSPNTSWLPAEMLDDRGFVRVEPTLRVPGHSDVFAVGDVAATDPLRTSARNRGHLLVARNIRAHLEGSPLRDYRPPRRRWGSVLGPLRDGLIVFTPPGRGVRVPSPASDVVLQRLITHQLIYGGVRRRVR